MTQLIPLLMMYMMKYLEISKEDLKLLLIRRFSYWAEQAGINVEMFDYNDCVLVLSDIKSVKKMLLKFIKLLSLKIIKQKIIKLQKISDKNVTLMYNSVTLKKGALL